MDIGALFKKKPCVFALEVFPPKRDSRVESVYNTLDKLGELPFDYVSVTYSAGGSGNRAYTGEIARYLKDKSASSRCPISPACPHRGRRWPRTRGAGRLRH